MKNNKLLEHTRLFSIISFFSPIIMFILILWLQAITQILHKGAGLDFGFACFSFVSIIIFDITIIFFTFVCIVHVTKTKKRRDVLECAAALIGTTLLILIQVVFIRMIIEAGIYI